MMCTDVGRNMWSTSCVYENKYNRANANNDDDDDDDDGDDDDDDDDDGDHGTCYMCKSLNRNLFENTSKMVWSC